MDPRKQVDVEYTSATGQRTQRRIEPVEGQITYNYADRKDSLPEWLIIALDISGDGALKTFKLARIHSWRPVPEGTLQPPAGYGKRP